MATKRRNPAAFTIWSTAAFLFASVILICWFDSGSWLQLLAGFFVTLFFLFGIVVVCKAARVFNGFSDFIIGDEGGFSLSRLQAVSWAVVIISYQISVIILLLSKGKIDTYQIVFSEQVMWLLGLSLGNYVAVKGITTSKVNENPKIFKRRTPKLMDLISGDNGLDFSRFQMLIWTIIGLFIFETKCLAHLRKLNDAKTDSEILILFTTQLDEYAPTTGTSNTADNAEIPVPYLPWSFIVLMGLSQGAYVGKKLVPSFKLDELKESKEKDLAVLKIDFEAKQQMLENMVTIGSKHGKSALDIASMAGLKKEIATVEKRIAELTTEIAKINSFTK
jgi:hypothetical protein